MGLKGRWRFRGSSLSLGHCGRHGPFRGANCAYCLVERPERFASSCHYCGGEEPASTNAHLGNICTCAEGWEARRRQTEQAQARWEREAAGLWKVGERAYVWFGGEWDRVEIAETEGRKFARVRSVSEKCSECGADKGEPILHLDFWTKTCQLRERPSWGSVRRAPRRRRQR